MMETPITVYGSAISYYTGKFEGYLRYKEIPYDFVAASPSVRRRMKAETGAAQLPAMRLADGRWLTDTTPMIDWIEQQRPEPAVIPTAPVVAFVSRLVEDYAEEWLWRPAMHYRWSHRADALLLSRRIVDEMMPRVPLPGSAKRALVRRRQRRGWVDGDGVTTHTRDHVERCYLDTLDHLETIFADRPFLLGDRPTLGDFGFFASMFRHFGQDPTPAEIMRRRAPGVYAWQARLWNARPGSVGSHVVDNVPADLGPILDDIGSAYLPYLNANARGWRAGEKRHDAWVQGLRYRELPVSQYRVWCLERLREHYGALEPATAAEARTLLGQHRCWDPLWEIDDPDSRYPRADIPFRGRKVHYHNADR